MANQEVISIHYAVCPNKRLWCRTAAGFLTFCRWTKSSIQGIGPFYESQYALELLRSNCIGMYAPKILHYYTYIIIVLV